MFELFPGNRLILQSESSECGLACLAMICRAHGRSESLSDLRRRFALSQTGASLRNVMSITDLLGFSARPLKLELDELDRLQLPCILHWNLDHYVVLTKVRRGKLTVLDPARGLLVLSQSEASAHFTGVALELTPTPDFERRAVSPPVRLSDLWSRMSGLVPLLGQLFALTLLLQFFGLLLPLANQIVIDDVIGRGDRDLLFAVLIGFGGVAVIQTAVNFLRDLIQLHAGQRLAVQLNGNLLRHLLRLPVDFFERRHIGDIVSRFGSLDPVQQFLTAGVIGVALDALMILPLTVVMFMYSPMLAGLVVANVVLVFAVQAATFRRNRQLSDEVLSLSARTQSIFMESVRAIKAVKLSGREAQRQTVWHNAMTDQQNATFRQSIFNLWGSSGFELVLAAQGLLMLFLGALEIMNGRMSLGMLMAFQAYASQFSTRANSLVGQFFVFKMLGLHLERLGDIVHTDQEKGLEVIPAAGAPMAGALEIRDLSFRYAPQDPWIFRDASIRIGAGERIALVGPSGGGKSTLLKLLTGLYHPAEGELAVDSRPISVTGLRRLREQIGVVMQDDQLLSGTIADNVALFDTDIDMTRVQEVCEIAHIHHEIASLPLGYNSLIGDMGSILSGGQKQRVLLARALYRDPKILFMDEGTANLDAGLEQSILARLKTLGITQVMVAHRQAAIDFAQRVFHVEYGQIREVRPVRSPAEVSHAV